MRDPPRPPPASFLPSRDGFAFSNSWPAAPAFSVRTPVGAIGIGNAARGLCGGMVFAALDYWHARTPPPASRPAPGAPLYRFIVRRLIESWNIPAGVATYYRWMNTPDRDARIRLRAGSAAGPSIRGLTWRSAGAEWPRIRARLDTGRPAPLGLVTVASANPLLLGRNHQVLACGYQLDGSYVTMTVYDPNSGGRDGVFIQFDQAAPGGPAGVSHNLAISWPVRGFFLTRYAPAWP